MHFAQYGTFKSQRGHRVVPHFLSLFTFLFREKKLQALVRVLENVLCAPLNKITDFETTIRKHVAQFQKRCNHPWQQLGESEDGED